MTKYYYVGVSLPSLSFNAPPEISFSKFEDLLRQNLTVKDYQKTKKIRELYDILNLRSLWLGEELDPRGELNVGEIEEALMTHTGLPDYVYDFLAQYEKLPDRLRHFPWLLAQFFKRVEDESNGFLHNYLIFEREWRLVFAGFRAKKLGRDLNIELQHENPEEDLIAQILAQKDAKEYEPPEKYENLKILFEKYGDDPLLLERALDEYRFDYIESLVADMDQFSINRILAYMVQLIIVEKWFELDKNKGIKIVDQIVKGTS
jgi:hypothetical protein